MYRSIVQRALSAARQITADYNLIESNWKDAIKKALRKKHPNAGWPKDLSNLRALREYRQAAPAKRPSTG
jgi:hypothetical protein